MFSLSFLRLGGVLPSPSPTHYTFSRWSTSRLNSGTNSSSTSPCGSARSSFNYRQPYLGWRSQEKLTKPRTPAERLAAGLLPHNQVTLMGYHQRCAVVVMGKVPPILFLALMVRRHARERIDCVFRLIERMRL